MELEKFNELIRADIKNLVNVEIEKAIGNNISKDDLICAHTANMIDCVALSLNIAGLDKKQAQEYIVGVLNESFKTYYK